ncbi:hypothetical protein [Chenggangzhangella methanolivorans]|uniref:PNPLA domain-containing protein n=1 Tax=Chenggangzhangella methanolivorans TaxID=1437009 RepID=A0A9E6RHX7_9HYPH|nr:hypothetical protein [Chenggangzhangella methanolivorans]QZO01761.1 hypothetical protein K6K41_10570 [Chenggangzhangella methanolivorans]
MLDDVTMLEVFEGRGISLAIPTVLMSEHRAWVFKKTPKSGVRDDRYPLVDVCMATSAAPIYRSLAAIDDPNAPDGPKQVFADGGLWANNPMVGLVDALTVAPPSSRSRSTPSALARVPRAITSTPRVRTARCSTGRWAQTSRRSAFRHRSSPSTIWRGS